MDIKNLTNNIGAGRANDAVKQHEKDGNQNPSNTAASANTDRVTLTDALSQVRLLETKSKEVTIDNSERIAAIKEAIQQGSFPIDAQRIADKLIQTEALFSKA